MKPNTITHWKQWTFAGLAGLGLAASSATAQTVIEVAGDGVIGDEILTTNAVPINGSNWTTEGNQAGGGQFIESHLVSPDIVVPTTGTVTLTFDHRFNLEGGNWDGGAIFVSIDGAPATYVPGTALTGEVYDGTATNGTAWPGGEEVFFGTSTGTPAFVQTVADLGILNAGQTVSVEFRCGWDEGFTPAGTDWEISTVKLTDSVATDFFDVDFAVDGPSNFTLASAGGGNLTDPWIYALPTISFEADVDTLTADRYAPNAPGDVIDLNGAAIAIEVVAGTLDIGDTITIFDLSGGTTLTGSFSSVTLPAAGVWDTSNLETTGTITCLDAASPLIYEPFNDLDLTLSGNVAGAGLSGTWSPGENHIADGSLKYGTLAYQGGRAVVNPGDEFNTNGISHGTTLTGAGLMDDGATLWFSVIIVKRADISASTNDRRTYFTLGTGQPDGFDRIGGNSGSGFGIAVNKTNNAIQARGWNNGSDGSGGAGGFTGGSPDTSVPEGATFLAVGKITWGAFGVADDVLEIYLPDLDLNLGSPVSTLSGDFDQLGASDPANAFDTVGFAGGRRANLVPELDEIRFGATSADVLPKDFTAPVLATTDNASGGGTSRVATFDEWVYAGTGDIRIVNETVAGTTTLAITDPQIVIFENTLTFTPTVPLTGGNSYHIEIDAGALTDRNLNDFAGISSPTEWAFTVDGTPPTVASFGDDTHPLPVLTNAPVTYTVTFDEAIDPGTVEIADFAATAGSAPITIDSVTATGSTTFDVAITTGGTPGTLALEIVASAVITDVNGNDLDTTAAIPSDNTLNVNAPVATAASVTNDFQGTIASEQHPTYPGEARYFHVSVNPANPGTGSYCATIVGTNDPAPEFVRNFGGDVVAYKFLGGTNNSIAGVTGSGGEPDRITYATEDIAFDGFGQQQLRLWATNDPGADLATGANTSATGFDSIGNYGYRSFGGAVGTIDISGLASGSLHIYYGAFNATPSVKVTLKDTDNVSADIVLNDAHSIADGGNGDAANRTEYYLAEIDFVTDGAYEIIEFEWLANGSDYSGNGRGLACVLTGPEPVDDYTTWSDQFAPADLTDPDADLDGDGLTNNDERLFGLDPTDPSSQNPYAIPLDAAAGTFSFTRRDNALTGLFTDIETSTDLQNWTVDSGAVLVEGAVDGNGVETIGVTLSAALLTNPELYVRVNQNAGVVFSEDFEADNGGFSATGSPNDWAYGTPMSDNDFNLILTTGNNASTGAWGTVLGDGSTPSGLITVASNSILRSPDIDLSGGSGASLSFAAAIDANTGDTLEVIVRDAGDDSLIATIPIDTAPVNTDWADYGPFAIASTATVYLEFRYVGTDGQFLGLYIDDVVVTKTP